MKFVSLVSIMLLIPSLSQAQFGGVLGKAKEKVTKTVLPDSKSSTSEQNSNTSSGEILPSTSKPTPASPNIPTSDEQKKIESELEWFSLSFTGRIDEVRSKLKQFNRTPEYFEELKTKYATFPKSSTYTLGRIKATEQSYVELSEKHLPNLEKDLTRIFEKLNQTTYNGNDLLLDGAKQEQWRVNPTYVVDDLDKFLAKANEDKKFLFQDKTGITILITKAEAEKIRLNQYIASDYPKYKEKYMISYLKTINLGKPGMTDPALTNFVKTKFDPKGGKVIKAVITSTTWMIDKANSGIPTHKWVEYNASVKKEDGKCYKAWGRVVMKYEGGGTYGDKYLTYRDDQEMSCENVNK